MTNLEIGRNFEAEPLAVELEVFVIGLEERQKALDNAQGRIEHLLAYVNASPEQEAFSAHFVLEDPFHNLMHTNFLDELGSLGIFDEGLIKSPEVTTDRTKVMDINDVTVFRQGYVSSNKAAGIWDKGDWVDSGIGGVTYFAERKEPTDLE